MVNQLNSTNATSIKDWGLQVCSLEDNLSKAAEGTGLAFIIFTQAIVELPGNEIFLQTNIYVLIKKLACHRQDQLSGQFYFSRCCWH